MDGSVSVLRRHAARNGVFAVTLLAAAVAPAQVTYRITDLGPATQSFGLFLNDAGQASDTYLLGDGSSRAFFWSDGTRIDLGVLAGSNHTTAGSINAHGHITGTSGPAFIWRPGSGMQNIGTICGSIAFGAGINDAGHVAGSSNAVFDENAVAVRFTPNTGMVALEPLLAPAAAAAWDLRIAYDINNKGQISGIGLFKGSERGFVLTPVQCPAPRGLPARAGLADGPGVGQSAREHPVADYSGCCRAPAQSAHVALEFSCADRQRP